MKLVVFSHKESWRDPADPSRIVTIGGFPMHMEAIAGIFDETEVVCTLRRGAPPNGARPIEGHNLTVRPLPEPPGRELLRKLALPFWLVRHYPVMWRACRRADVVHAVLLGDIGTLGLATALLQRKRCFSRHCGLWTYSETLAARLTKRLLVATAGERHVVFATGGGETPPEPGNPSIAWIFSSSLWARDAARLPQAEPWAPGQQLRLVTVGRLDSGKNLTACLDGLAILRGHGVDAVLEIVGDGPLRSALAARATELGLAERVELPGSVGHAEVLWRLARSHLFVFPSKAEGFPKAVLEALACGVPVVATPVSVLPSLLSAGGGVTVPEGAGAALAAAVADLVAAPERLRQMAEKARQTARAYTLERWQDAFRSRLEATWGEPLRAVAS